MDTVEMIQFLDSLFPHLSNSTYFLTFLLSFLPLLSQVDLCKVFFLFVPQLSRLENVDVFPTSQDYDEALLANQYVTLFQ